MYFLSSLRKGVNIYVPSEACGCCSDRHVPKADFMFPGALQLYDWLLSCAW